MDRDWAAFAEAELVDALVVEYEFPEARARKLARVLIELSELEFGEDE